MNGNSHRTRRPARLTRAVALAAAIVAIAPLAAACGSGDSSASTPTTNPAQLTAQRLDSFAACMRGHGVANFYFSRAPGTSRSALMAKYPGGFVKLGQWAAPADPGSPRFQSAQKACQRLLPVHRPGAGQVQAMLRRLVKAAACMRSHGYPAYPDPSEHGGAIARPPLPSSINTSSPQFQAALKKCNGG